jgi:hypothetical protein
LTAFGPHPQPLSQSWERGKFAKKGEPQQNLLRLTFFALVSLPFIHLEQFLHHKSKQEITMLNLNSADILLAMILSLFLLGTITFASGIVILLTRTVGRDVSAITSSTSKLAQKALANDIAGLVGNASVLLNATNEMVRTSAGVGVLLLFIGLLLIGIALGLAVYFLGGSVTYDALIGNR